MALKLLFNPLAGTFDYVDQSGMNVGQAGRYGLYPITGSDIDDHIHKMLI